MCDGSKRSLQVLRAISVNYPTLKRWELLGKRVEDGGIRTLL
jgi:hypothetical protein